MKYRIRIITYKNGRKSFTAQKKVGLYWVGLDYDGSTNIFYDKLERREQALNSIDKNFAGNTQKQIIEFEYINK